MYRNVILGNEYETLASKFLEITLDSSQPQHCKGFTLMELMVLIAISALTLSLGVPSFVSIVQNSRLTAGTNEFVSALHQARGSAIERGVRTTLCPSYDAADCDIDAEWNEGWILFVDNDADGVLDVGEMVLTRHAALNGPMLISDNPGQLIAYLPSGESRIGANRTGSFTIYDSRGTGRLIQLNRTGHISTAYTEVTLPP